MKKLPWTFAVLAIAPLLQCYPETAWAQDANGGFQQTWISATGSDSNTSGGCQASVPCASFGEAIPQTAEGGELSCLGGGEAVPYTDISGGANTTSGVTITGTITIDCHGTGATHMLINGLNGFVINAPGSVVTLRGLNIDGYTGHPGGNAGNNGIVIQAAAAVVIEDCVIENFPQSGISVTTAADTVLIVRNTSIRNAANGISFAPTGGAVNGSIDHAMIAKMSGDGITATGAAYFTVTNSVISNAASVGVNVGSGAVLEVDSSSVSNNSTGFATSGGIIRISRNVIYDNTTNYSITGGTIATSGDNKVAVNGSTAPNGSITQQ